MTDFRGQVIRNETIVRGWRIINYPSTSEEDTVYLTDNKNFYDALSAKVNVARVGVSKVKHGVTSEYLTTK